VPDGAAGLLRVDPVTGQTTVLSAGEPFVFPRSVTIASDRRIFVGDISLFQGQPSRIIQVNPGTGAATLVRRAPALNPALCLGGEGVELTGAVGSRCRWIPHLLHHHLLPGFNHLREQQMCVGLSLDANVTCRGQIKYIDGGGGETC
jgi:hypothetical protein